MSIADLLATKRTRRYAAPVVEINVNPTERHYTVEEIADMWRLSRATVRRVLRNKPGVLKFGSNYVTLRVPESALKQIHEEMTR